MTRPFKRKDENMPDSGFAAPRGERDEFQRALERLRNFSQAAAERPDDFWARQRAAIWQKIQPPRRPARRMPVWAGLAAGITLLLCLTQFSGKEETYVFSFAVGDDQDLLLEVERALNRQYPEALAPAHRLSRELENAAEAARADTDFANTP